MKETPFNKRPTMNAKKSYARTEKSVRSVAKDTNKTRRRMVKPVRGK